ncbi:MAG: DUF2304 domain-containing protein [Clostridia bacterium]|nr:DUF2304 domain-containing protein [Clostridia bacterium]
MSVVLRVVLIVVSVIVVFFAMRKIRKAQLNIDDSIFWILFSLILLVVSIFPQIAIWAAGLLGIESPANFVFLFMIFVVLVKLFQLAIDLSVLKHRLNRLAQKISLNRYDDTEKKDEKNTENT